MMKILSFLAVMVACGIVWGCASQGGEVMVDTSTQQKKKVLGPAPEFNANSLGDPTLSGQ